MKVSGPNYYIFSIYSSNWFLTRIYFKILILFSFFLLGEGGGVVRGVGVSIKLFDFSHNNSTEIDFLIIFVN